MGGIDRFGGEGVVIGGEGAFSASAKDLNLGRGNCVAFRDDGLGFNRVLNGMGVFRWDVVCNYVFMEGEYNSWMTLFITIFVLILD